MALNFKNLNVQLQEMEQYVPFLECRDPLVSQVSVGWHLSHSFEVINKVCAALETSNPEDYKSEFSLSRIMVFTMGRFPRGKAKAPKNVMPNGEINPERLSLQLDDVKVNLSKFESLQKNNYCNHPYFKQLNRNQSKRLLEVHTKHHLKIIRDILKQN